MSTNTEAKKPLQDPRDVLRNAVARVEDELPIDAPAKLRSAWKDLVDTLALGPSPALRECPACRSICMRDAVRCGHCWAKLVPADRV